MPRFSVFHNPPNAVATYQTLGFFGSISTSCTRPVVSVGPILRNSKPFRALAVRPEGSCAPRRAAHAAAAANATDRIRRFMRTSPQKSRNSLTPGQARILRRVRCALDPSPRRLSEAAHWPAFAAVHAGGNPRHLGNFYRQCRGVDELRGHGGSAQARRHQRPRRHGAVDDDLRRQRQTGLHDLQGTADRGAAREDVAEPDQGGHLGRGSALLSSTAASTRSASRGASSATARRAGAPKAAAPSRSSSRVRASSRRDKTYRRKLKEVILAAYIESMYTKNEILELYLNKVYFGDGLYGVEAASRGYFGKTRLGSDRRRGGAARRPDPVAVELRADRQPRTRASPGATSCCRRWSASGAIDAADGRTRQEGAGQADQRPRDQRDLRPVLQGAGAPRAGRAVRLAARVPGRPARLHHASTSTCSAAPKRWSRRAWRTSRGAAASSTRRARSIAEVEGRRAARLPAGRARRDGSRPPATCARMVGGRDFTESRFNRADAGEAAVRLGVQAVRLRGGARGGLHAGDA